METLILLSKSIFRAVLISLALTLFLSGCAMDGHRCVSVTNGNKVPVNGILVVPLYSESFGVGFGPDGKGPQTKCTYTIKKPFIFNSGDDFMKERISTRGIIIPPFLYIGQMKNAKQWLFVKVGYRPKIVRDTDIYGDSLIIMTSSTDNAAREVIDLLLTPQHDKSVLKKMFSVEIMREEITVKLDEKDVKLLKANRE